MYKISSIVLASIFLTLAAVGLSSAQDQEDEDLLPDIDPQDIEIRGEFSAQFSGLSRQPILGFNPDPRVYQIDSDREPFMESEDEIGAELPVSDLSRPLPPDFNKPDQADDASAFARAGFGSFASPEVQAWATHQITDNSYLGGNIDYFSTAGHLDDEGSSYRFLDSNAEFGTRINEKTLFRISGGHTNDFNEMLEVDEISSSFNQDLPDISNKTYRGYQVDAGVRGVRNGPAGWAAKAGFQTHAVDLNAGDLSGEADESVYHASAANTWTGSRPHETFKASLAAEGGTFTAQDADALHWSIMEAGATYERLFNYTTQLTASLNGFYVIDAEGEQFYPGPEILLKHWLQDRLKLEGSISASPYHETQRQLHRENRFLNTENNLQHSFSIDAQARGTFEYYRGSTVSAGLSYDHVLQRPYFQRDEVNGLGSTPLARTFYRTNYSDAEILKGFASITHQLKPERFWVQAEAYVQSPMLEGGNQIPYEESWGVNAGMTLRPIDELSIEGSLDFIGPRETGTEDETLDPFVLLGSRANIQLMDKIGVYAEFKNMLGRDYEWWEGYTERPFQAFGGVTVKL